MGRMKEQYMIQEDLRARLLEQRTTLSVLELRLGEIDLQRSATLAGINRCKGAIEEIEYWLNDASVPTVGTGNGDEPPRETEPT